MTIYRYWRTQDNHRMVVIKHGDDYYFCPIKDEVDVISNVNLSGEESNVITRLKKAYREMDVLHNWEDIKKEQPNKITQLTREFKNTIKNSEDLVWLDDDHHIYPNDNLSPNDFFTSYAKAIVKEAHFRYKSDNWEVNEELSEEENDIAKETFDDKYGEAICTREAFDEELKRRGLEVEWTEFTMKILDIEWTKCVEDDYSNERVLERMTYRLTFPHWFSINLEIRDVPYSETEIVIQKAANHIIENDIVKKITKGAIYSAKRKKEMSITTTDSEEAKKLFKMPVEYHCRECGAIFYAEKHLHQFDDAPQCPDCGVQDWLWID